MSPAEASLLMKVGIGAVVLFGIGYIGNLLSFSNRFANALVTAIVFAVIYGALYYFIDKSTLPADLQQMSQQTWFQMVGIAAVVVFVIDLIANMISFKSRFTNALMTAIVFAVVFGALMYTSGALSLPPVKPA